MKPYRIKVSIRNNLLLNAIEEQGYPTVAAFERAMGVTSGRMNGLVSMRLAPLLDSGEFSKEAKMAMEVLGAAPTDLWTEQQLTIKLHRNSGQREIDADLVHHLLEQRRQMDYLPSPEDHLLERETNQLVDDLLNTIRPREKEVLINRFQNDETYKEAGKKMNVTQERVRQIEATALRKLRDPAKHGHLNKSGLIKINKYGATLDD
tara:strand:+ start:240 stop:857 length:618 start_codon:yes stop_codon:yes gene_type:complete